MNNSRLSIRASMLILMIIAGGVLTFPSMTMATRGINLEKMPVAKSIQLGMVELDVRGSSAGISTVYFKQSLADAILASGIFSDSGNNIDNDDNDTTPYLLEIRIVKIDTLVDSSIFSIRKNVGMNVIWTLYRTSDETVLFTESIYSTYKGGWFEGGLPGSNRVRVALEAASLKNVHTGMEMLESLDFRQD